MLSAAWQISSALFNVNSLSRSRPLSDHVISYCKHQKISHDLVGCYLCEIASFCQLPQRRAVLIIRLTRFLHSRVEFDISQMSRFFSARSTPEIFPAQARSSLTLTRRRSSKKWIKLPALPRH